MSDPSKRITQAVAWYRLHKANITAALPLALPGRSFPVGWPDEVLEKYIVLWEAGQLSPYLGSAYIANPLRAIKKELKRPGSE